MSSSEPSVPEVATEPRPSGVAQLILQRIREVKLLELIRFGAVGFTSMGIYFVLLWCIHRWLPMPVSIQAAMAYGPCMIANYLLHRTFTFRSRSQHMHAGPRYVTVQLGGMLINSGVLWLGVDFGALPYPPVQVAAFALMASWNYLGQKFWTFSA